MVFIKTKWYSVNHINTEKKNRFNNKINNYGNVHSIRISYLYPIRTQHSKISHHNSYTITYVLVL